MLSITFCQHTSNNYIVNIWGCDDCHHMQRIIKESLNRLMHRSEKEQSLQKKNDIQRNGSINDYILIYAKMKIKGPIIAVMSLIMSPVHSPQCFVTLNWIDKLDGWKLTNQISPVGQNRQQFIQSFLIRLAVNVGIPNWISIEHCIGIWTLIFFYGVINVQR